MKIEKLIKQNGKCCITEKPMIDTKYINVVQLPMKAVWEYPIWGNFITGQQNMAIAYVHDDAIKNGSLIGPVKFAVEILDDKIIYHEIQRCKKCGCTEGDCSICVKRTGKPCHWVEADLCSACVDILSVYTIYEHPLDFPGAYVISKWDTVPGSPDPVKDPNYFFAHQDLAPCRLKLQKKGLYNIGRQTDDDPVILESWI